MFSNVGEKIKSWSIAILVISAIALIVGIVFTIIGWVDFFNEDLGFLLFLVTLAELAIGGAIATFIALLIYGFGIIVSNHEKIERDNMKKASAEAISNAGNYNSSLFKNMDTQKAPKGQPVQGEWKCPKCGKTNQNYVGTCGCGQVKPK